MRQVTRLALPESVETHNVSSTVCHALLALVWEYPVPFGLFFYVSRSAVFGTLFLGVSGELFTTGTPETIMCQCVCGDRSMGMYRPPKLATCNS